jgi:hypothetical protein
MEVMLHEVLILALYVGEWSLSRSGRFKNRQRTPDTHRFDPKVDRLDVLAKRDTPAPARIEPDFEPLARYFPWQEN